mgnify:FL=1
MKNPMTTVSNRCREAQLVLFNSAPAAIQRELESNTEFWLVPMKEKPRSERRETRIK